MRTKVLSVVAGSLMLLLVMSGTAWAPRTLAPVIADEPCSVQGGAGLLGGSAEIHSVAVVNGALVGTGWIDALCMNGETELGHVAEDGGIFDLTVEKASCKTIELGFGELTADGVTADLTDVSLSVVREGPRDRKLCGAAKAYRHGDLEAFAAALDAEL